MSEKINPVDEVVERSLRFGRCPDCGFTMYPVNGRPKCINCGHRDGEV